MSKFEEYMAKPDFESEFEVMNRFALHAAENASCEVKILASEMYKSTSPAGYEVEAILCVLTQDGKIVDGGASVRPNNGASVDVISYREAKDKAKDMVERWEALQEEKALHDRLIRETGGF